MAMQWIQASLAATIASLLPLVVTVFLWFFFKEKLNSWGLAGLIIGTIGLALIINSNIPTKLNIIGTLCCLIGVIALAIATITVRHSPNKNILMLIGLQMLLGSMTLFPLSIAVETWEITWTMSLIVSFLYTTIFPGLIATLIWFKLIHFVGPVRAAAFHFLNPFFGVLIANIVLSENLVWLQIFGVLLITIAIVSLQLSKTIKTPVA